MRAARLAFIFLGALALVMGVATGLARLAVDVPAMAFAQAGSHGALMIAAFLGTVISLERAVALSSAEKKRLWPFVAPALAGLAGLTLLSGGNLLFAQSLLIVAGTVLTVGSAIITRQQPVIHNATLALGSLCWLAGNIAWVIDGPLVVAVPWWMAFLVLTIAGERLELTRFLPTPRFAKTVFLVIITWMMLAMTIAIRWDEGLILFAAGLIALAAWLLRYDIARHTIKQTGLTRYIAVCLTAGYLWLFFGGVFGVAGNFAAGEPWRDAALHAVFLGFVFSMIFGHAPIILPAVAKLNIRYHPIFYLPLLLLHGSLAARVIGNVGDFFALRQDAAIANGAAILLFALTILATVLRSRRQPKQSDKVMRAHEA